jgi:hypothetical protein
MRRLAIAGLAGMLLCCAQTRSRSSLYVEPSIRPGSLRLRRVAVVPNRLPAHLEDAEKWRRFNWRVMEEQLRRRGFDVVDYETSVQAFERAGLPLEDARPTRDRYAELARSLGVDALFIPSYATSFRSEHLLVVHSSSFTSLVSLQIYFTEKSEVGGRIDASGTTSVQTGLILATGLGVGLPLQVVGAAPVCTGSGVAARCDANPLGTAGLLTVVAGALVELGYGLFMMAAGPDAHWERSFDEAIRKGLEPFFDRYAPGGGGAPASPAVPAHQPPPPPGGYAPPG